MTVPLGICQGRVPSGFRSEGDSAVRDLSG